jgi:hypothetical protein
MRLVRARGTPRTRRAPNRGSASGNAVGADDDRRYRGFPRLAQVEGKGGAHPPSRGPTCGRVCASDRFAGHDHCVIDPEPSARGDLTRRAIDGRCGSGGGDGDGGRSPSFDPGDSTGRTPRLGETGVARSIHAVVGQVRKRVAREVGSLPGAGIRGVGARGAICVRRTSHDTGGQCHARGYRPYPGTGLTSPCRCCGPGYSVQHVTSRKVLSMGLRRTAAKPTARIALSHI